MAQSIPWRERSRLRPRELAQVAGVSVRTVFRAIARRELRSFRQGRARCIPIASALEWLGEDVPPGTPRRAPSEDARRLVREVRRP